MKLPPTAQLLYFHLGMKADDDGVTEAFTVIRYAGCQESDLELLQEKGFVKILNDDLVTYITDWAENNQIRADRKKESIYSDILEKMGLSAGRQPSDNQVTTNCQPSDNQATTNCQPSDRLGKVSIVEDSIEEARKEKERIEEKMKSYTEEEKAMYKRPFFVTYQQEKTS